MFAPFNPIIKNKIGAKSLILLGFFLLTVTTVFLGSIARLNDPHDFKWFAVGLRCFQGIGDIMIQFTVYSVITNVFSDDMMKYIGYCEIWVGVGLGLGPMLGSAVYPLLEYEGTMYFFGALNLTIMILCIIFIPYQLNQTTSLDELAEVEAELEMMMIDKPQQKVQSIGWMTLLTNRHSVFALLICFVGTFNITFY